jgi:hypothetical protein
MMNVEHYQARAVLAIKGERIRQVEVEGMTAKHDDLRCDGELQAAAECYMAAALLPPAPGTVPVSWPMLAHEWKPRSAERNLVRAGALLDAEEDRLRRRDGAAARDCMVRSAIHDTVMALAMLYRHADEARSS